MFTALLFSLLLVAADPAPAAEPETTPPAPTTPAQTEETASADSNRLVCRRESKPNTRFTYKVCKTVAEWEERSKAAQEAFEGVRGRPMVKICSPTTGCD